MRRSIISTDDLEATSRAATPPELQQEFEPGDIQVVPMERMAKKAAEEKFMNESVEIQIESGTDENDPVFVQLGHGGSMQLVKRGEPQVVKRKYLYAALMAKTVRINCSFGTKDGEEFNSLKPTTNTTYRANLITDKNTEQGGARWVLRVMQESVGYH